MALDGDEARTLAAEIERLEAELAKANERVAKVTRIMYSDHVEKMDAAKAREAKLRAALERVDSFLLELRDSREVSPNIGSDAAQLWLQSPLRIKE